MINEFRKMQSKHQVWFAIMIIVGVVAIWRGVWGLLDRFGGYAFADNPELDFIVSIIIGLVILGSTHYVVKELM